MRFYADGATQPLFLSSGAEDYFLSASYFDEGMFKGPNSGLTYFDHHGGVNVCVCDLLGEGRQRINQNKPT